MFRNHTYENTDELPTAFRIVVQFVVRLAVRLAVRSVLRMCVILYRTHKIFMDFVVYYLHAIDPRIPRLLLN